MEQSQGARPDRSQSTTIRILSVALLAALAAIVALSLALCSRGTDGGQGPAAQQSLQQDDQDGQDAQAAAPAQGETPAAQDDWDDTAADEGDDAAAADGAGQGDGGQGQGAQAASAADSVPAQDAASGSAAGAAVSEDGSYTSKDDVALYIHTYGHLPPNFISKTKARDAGWVAKQGNLDEVLPGMSIGGSDFYNNEGQLPDAPGRTWTECDINYHGGYRGVERIVFSNDGLVFYTADHYQTFEQLY